MNYICPDCGYESGNPGNCPECETPLLKREDVTEELEGGSPGEGGLDEFDEEEDDEEW